MDDNNNREYNYQGSYQSPYSYQNHGGSTYGQNYGQNPYQNSGSGNGGNGGKKKGGFGKKLMKCAALALVFGLVSGAAFEGVHLAGTAIADKNGTSSAAAGEASGSILTQSDSGNRLSATSTSSTYVATDVSDIVEAAMPSIVAITNISETEYQSFWGGRTQTYESTSAGSGIIVSQDDDNLYIATNNHVVDGANSLTVTFADESTVSAEIKGTDPSTDLAVIRVSRDSIEADTFNQIKVATLGKSGDLRVGEASIAIGNALGYGQSVTTGCISALNREVSVSDSSSNTSYTAELIQTDAAINPGNSGGALLNAAGEVIGINSVKYSSTEVEGIGYAIPIDTAMPIIEDLITKEKVDSSDSAYLGIGGVDVTSDVSTTYNMPTGVYVAQVIEGSAAEKAGIQKGDIITEFDGKEIGSMSELTTRLQYYAAGTTVTVVVQRATNGEYAPYECSVTLGKKQ
jgi:serine protease Do